MAEPKTTALSRCPQCGAAFVCGMSAGLETCWCLEKPIADYASAPRSDIAQDASCLCPACLKSRLSETAT